MQNADNVKTLVPLFASKNHKEKKQFSRRTNAQILLFWPTAREMYTQAALWHCCPWQTVGGYIQYAFEYMTNIDTP